MNTSSNAILKIHDAALRLFSDRGTRTVSVSDLADAAGVARGTIYNNVADPDALFDQLAADLLHDMHLRVSASMSGVEDPASRIAIGVRLFIQQAHDEPSWARFVVRFGVSDDTLRRMLDEPPTIDLTRGMEKGRFNVTTAQLPSVLALLAGTTLAAMQGVLAGHQTWRDAGEHVVELIMRVLGLADDEAHAIATSALPALVPSLRTSKKQRSS